MKKTLKIIFAAIFGMFCLAEPVWAKDAVAGGLSRCLTTVIPSLYAMMIASGMLLSTGAIAAAGRYIDKFSRSVFGMDGETFGAFLFSMIAGYPVGARLINGRHDLENGYFRLCSGICFGAGSAFVFGCASSGGSTGWLILISTVSANFLTALLLSHWLRKGAPDAKISRNTAVSAAMLSDCVSSAGKGMAEICFAVLAFSALTAMLRRFGVISAFSGILSVLSGLPAETSDAVICAVLDVTAISELPRNDLSLLPLKSALVSFGGVCVFAQISAVFRGKISLVPMVTIRAAAAVLSYFICRGLLPIFIRGEVVTVAAMTSRLHHAGSPVPSVMLMLMTVFLLAELRLHKNA